MPAVNRQDCWSTWLGRDRFGGDAGVEHRTMERLRGIRDRVLDQARLAAGDTVLDVGCGDGLVAFGALDRGAGLCIFADISQTLLDESRRVAETSGVLERCRFVRAPADDLSGLASGTVDVVTTRSVLIYVEDKTSAFREFRRVLRPRGRVSIFEPVNRLNRLMRAYDSGAVRELDERLQGAFEELQPRDSDPMLNFDDRDLVELAERAGFGRVNLTLEVTVEPPEPMPWEAFLNMAWNPRIPTIRQMVERVLTPDEARRWTAHLRPLVEAGRGSVRMASAYLVAVNEERLA
jgi:arsenite methyltransferase